MCSTWSEQTLILADKYTHAARKSVMTRKRQNKKKRLAVTSDLSDDNTIDGSTSPQGYTARGTTHQGGCWMHLKCKYTSHLSPVTSHQSTMHRSTSHWSTSHRLARHWSTRHRATSHQSSSHRSFSDYRALNHEAPVTGHPVVGHQSLHQAPVIR